MYLASRLGALGALSGGELGRALASLESASVGSLGEDTETVLARLADEAGVPREVVLKAYRDELTALDRVADRAGYLRDRLERLHADHAAQADRLGILRAQIMKLDDPAKRAELLFGIARAEKQLALAERVMKELEARQTMSGLGFAPAAIVPFIVPVGVVLVMAALTVWTMVYLGGAKEKIDKLVDQMGSAFGAATYVALIGGTVLGLLWLTKVARDIWIKPQEGT